MCGIAGIIHRSAGGANVGAEMTSILQALKHRGPDSSGFAVYGNPRPDQIVMRFKVAERADMEKGPSMLEEVKVLFKLPYEVVSFIPTNRNGLEFLVTLEKTGSVAGKSAEIPQSFGEGFEAVKQGLTTCADKDARVQG